MQGLFRIHFASSTQSLYVPSAKAMVPEIYRGRRNGCARKSAGYYRKHNAFVFEYLKRLLPRERSKLRWYRDLFALINTELVPL